MYLWAAICVESSCPSCVQPHISYTVRFEFLGAVVIVIAGGYVCGFVYQSDLCVWISKSAICCFIDLGGGAAADRVRALLDFSTTDFKVVVNWMMCACVLLL